MNYDWPSISMPLTYLSSRSIVREGSAGWKHHRRELLMYLATEWDLQGVESPRSASQAEIYIAGPILVNLH
jgi:hypothetical protein